MKHLLVIPFLLIGLSIVHAETKAETKENYQAKIEKELKELGDDVERLKAGSENAGSKSRAEVDRQMGNLQKKLGVARERLEELQSTTSVQWDKLRHKMDSALQDLKKTYKRTANRIEPAQP